MMHKLSSLLASLLLLAALHADAGEFESAKFDYALEIPDSWRLVDASFMAELAKSGEAEKLGVEPEGIESLATIAADKEVDYFLLKFTDDYSDNLNVMRLPGTEFAPPEDTVKLAAELAQGYAQIYGSEAKVSGVTCTETAQKAPFNTLTYVIELPKLGLTQRAYMIFADAKTMYNFTLTARSERFEAADKEFQTAIKTLKLLPPDRKTAERDRSN